MLARMAPTSTAVTANASRLREPEQRWRGKYLRALNVCPPASDRSDATALQRRKSLSALSMRARLRAQRSWREDPTTNAGGRRSETGRPDELDAPLFRMDGREASFRMLRPTSRVSFAATTQAKVFDRGLTRSTRSRSDWAGFRPDEERGSAPIEIPATEAPDFERETKRTTRRVASERACVGLDRRRTNSTSASTSQSHSSSGRGGLVGWGSNTNPSGTTECSDELDGYVEDEWDDDDDEEEEQLQLELEDLERSHDDNDNDNEGGERGGGNEGDIFAMEEDLELEPESESDDGAVPLAMRSLHLRPEGQLSLRARSLRRAASENVLPIGRARPMAMPRRSLLDGLQEHAVEADMARLPDSFVPPHEMVQRDCFSLGLRDQLKRRPDQEHVI